jgi:AcrR family transcriptional regulator
MANPAYTDVQVEKRDPPRRNKPRNAEKTLGEIMDVAEALFAQYGYEGTSLRQVAVGVNMSQPNFYNYFSSKEKLYESVLARSLVPLMTLIGDGLAKSATRKETDLDDDVFYEVIDAFMALLAKNRNLAGLLYQESVRGSRTAAKLATGVFDKILSQSAQGLGKSNKGGWPRDQIPFLVIAWFNLVFGYFASASLIKGVLPRNSDPLSRRALQTQRLFLRNAWTRLMRS